jgi:hypothetical protein
VEVVYVISINCDISLHHGHAFAFSRRDAPELCRNLVPPRTEGAGNAGCALHPRSRTQRRVGVHARAYRLSGGTRHPLRNGFTAYAALSPATNSSCHRRRRILRLLNPVGFELATADLAPATGVGTTRFCRTLKRRSSCAPANRSRGSTRPATVIRADALASTTSRPTFVTTRDRPSCRNGMAGNKPLIWGVREPECYPSCQSAAGRRAIACWSGSCAEGKTIVDRV